MKGFHLYAALVGSLVVAVVVGYAVYLNHLERAKVNMALELQKRSQYIPYVDIMKEESFATTSTVFRSVLERFLRVTPLKVPREVYESGDFEEWMWDNFFSSQSVRNSFALYLMAELRAYSSTVSQGMKIDVEGDARSLSEALAEGVHIVPKHDATYIVINPSEMTQSTLEALPRLRVCKGSYCKIVSIFPLEKTEITIPLRLGKAFQKARDAYMYINEHKRELELAAGFCKEDCPTCGVFQFNRWDMEPVYPEDVDCEEIVINLESGMDHTGYYRALGIEGGGCANLALALGDHFVPCSEPQSLLKAFMDNRLSELWEGREGNITFEDAFISTEPVKLFVYRKVVDASVLLSGATVPIPLEVFEALGINVRGKSQLIPVSSCKKYGFGYCAFPRRLYFLYSWTDDDNRYSVSGAPMEYRFVIDLGEDEELNRYIRNQSIEAKNLANLDDTASASYSCLQRLDEYCQPGQLKDLLASVCHFTGTTLEEMREELPGETNECQAVAEIFIGEGGACWNKERACSRGLTLATQEKIEECAKDRLAQCWKGLYELYDEGICELDTSARLECQGYRLGSEWIELTNILGEKIFQLVRGDEVSRESLVLGAFNKLGDPYKFCIASQLVLLYENNEAEGTCFQELNYLLGSATSPCTNPVANCLLTSSITIDPPTSELCTATSGAKLLSTLHVNIFDPSYISVGCYEGN